MVMESLLRFLGIKSARQKGKHVSGARVQVVFYARPQPSSSSRSFPTEAVYIPSNPDHRMSRSFAERMGLDLSRGSSGSIKADWKIAWSRKQYLHEYDFIIMELLPENVDVVFGHNDILNVFPNFPSPFDGEGITMHKFPKIFTFSEPLPRRTGSMKKFAEFRRTASWPFVTKSKRSTNALKRSPSVHFKSPLTKDEPTASNQQKQTASVTPGEIRLLQPHFNKQQTRVPSMSLDQKSQTTTILSRGKLLSGGLESNCKAHEVHPTPRTLQSTDASITPVPEPQTPDILKATKSLMTPKITHSPVSSYPLNTSTYAKSSTSPSTSLDTNLNLVQMGSSHARNPVSTELLPSASDTIVNRTENSDQNLPILGKPRDFNLIEQHPLNYRRGHLSFQPVSAIPPEDLISRTDQSQASQGDNIAALKTLTGSVSDPVCAPSMKTVRHNATSLTRAFGETGAENMVQMGNSTSTIMAEGLQDFSQFDSTLNLASANTIFSTVTDLAKTRIETTDTGDYKKQVSLRSSVGRHVGSFKTSRGHEEGDIISSVEVPHNNNNSEAATVAADYTMPSDHISDKRGPQEGTKPPSRPSTPSMKEESAEPQTEFEPELSKKRSRSSSVHAHSFKYEPARSSASHEDLPESSAGPIARFASGSVSPAILQASRDYWTWEEASKLYYHINSDTGSTRWYEDTELDSDEERDAGGDDR